MSQPSAWLTALLQNLAGSGAAGQAAASYIHEHRILIGVHAQPTGARWTLTRHIQLQPQFANGPASSPYALSLLVHEVQHLRQGFLTALSVYGELEAWQAQFGFLKAATGSYDQDRQKDQLIADLISLPLGWDRSALARARNLMRAYAGTAYRVDLLPLFPLDKEVAFRIFRAAPTGT